MVHLAVFASGSGSNAQNIIEHFHASGSGTGQAPSLTPARVDLVVCNKANAYVLERAARLGVPTYVMDREDFRQPDSPLARRLEQAGIECVILAGFLLKVPQWLLQRYPDRVINIHPALLPRYGGKGMYGHHVHEAVVAAGEKTSGITIHLVDDQYDHGRHLFQATCEVLPTDGPDEVAAKIHTLEGRWFPTIIDRYLAGQALPVAE